MLEVGDWVEIISIGNKSGAAKKYLNTVQQIIIINASVYFPYKLRGTKSYIWSEEQLRKVSKKEALAYEIAANTGKE